MEVWDLYDENKNITGKDCIRGEEIPDNYYHLVVHVWIKNNKNEYLISQRSITRPRFPLMWECVGGSLIKDEDSLQGAIREVYEEVGIDLSNCNSKLIKTILREEKQDIVDVWLFEYTGNIDLKNATTDEVADAKWMSKDEIDLLRKKGVFVNTLYYFFDL